MYELLLPTVPGLKLFPYLSECYLQPLLSKKMWKGVNNDPNSSGWNWYDYFHFLKK